MSATAVIIFTFLSLVAAGGAAYVAVIFRRAAKTDARQRARCYAYDWTDAAGRRYRVTVTSPPIDPEREDCINVP